MNTVPTSKENLLALIKQISYRNYFCRTEVLHSKPRYFNLQETIHGD